MSRLIVETLVLEAALPGAANPLPTFRDPAFDRTVRLFSSVPDRFRAGAGRHAGYRCLPYGRQDTYSRNLKPHPFRSLVLENRHLRAVFLPELGARLYSLTDKASGRELLYRNPCVQVANLAIRNAWFSGGIEWNLGQLGHAAHTCATVASGRFTDPDGTEGLRVWDYERMSGLFWQIDFRLSETEPVLYATVRIANPLDRSTNLYWWTNTAVPETDGTRVLASADEVLCLMPNNEGIHTFAGASLPGLPSLDGADGTYAANYRFANEFFFVCEGEAHPWEAAVDERGLGFFESSTAALAYRKLFVWGSHPGGRRWQDYLAPAGGGRYLEVQAGLAPTQLHGLDLAAGGVVSFTQAFGAFAADPNVLHNPQWPVARTAADVAVRKALPTGALDRVHTAALAAATLPVTDRFTDAASWGVFEQDRTGKETHLWFPDPAEGSPEADWAPLLTGGVLGSGGPGAIPGAWMVQPEWRELLVRSLDRPGGNHAAGWLAYGVLCVEAGDEVQAQAAFDQAWLLDPTPLAARNRGALARRQKNLDEARLWYRRASDRAGAAVGVDLARELLEFWLEAGTDADRAEARARLAQWPAAVVNDDRVALLTARLALADGAWDRVLALLDRDFACIREGELSVSELWLGAHAGRLGVDRAEAERRFPVPARLDFRMV